MLLIVSRCTTTIRTKMSAPRSSGGLASRKALAQKSARKSSSDGSVASKADPEAARGKSSEDDSDGGAGHGAAKRQCDPDRA
jgi:hypothetical protein